MASVQNQSNHSAPAEIAADALDVAGIAARTTDTGGAAVPALDGALATDEATGSAGKPDDAGRAAYASRMAARHGMVGPPDLWEMKRRFQIAFLKGAGLRPHHRLLDLGCGTLRGGIPLIEYLAVGHYTGVDVRPTVLEEGRRELEEAGLVGRAPRLVCCEDLRDFDDGRRFDVIWAFAVLIHMSDPVLDAALAAVARHIESSGVFYATVHIGERSEGNWQGFPIVTRSIPFYEQAASRHGLSLCDIGSLNSLGHVHPRLSAERQSCQRMLRISPQHEALDAFPTAR